MPGDRLLQSPPVRRVGLARDDAREPASLQTEKTANRIAVERPASHQDFIRQQAEEIRKVVLLRPGQRQAVVIQMEAKENLCHVLATRSVIVEQIEGPANFAGF